jgi:hypothetical protein
MRTRAKPRAGIVRSILDITLGRLLKWAFMLALIGVVLAAVGFALFVYVPAKEIPTLEKVDGYVYLDQGWGTTAESNDRQTYYYSAQGTSLPQGALLAPLRYDWFVNLEMPLDQARFADPDHLRRYRFIVDPKPTPANPDRLPVGFTSMRHSANTCSVSPVRRATPANCMRKRTARISRSASTAVRRCTRSPACSAARSVRRWSPR